MFNPLLDNLSELKATDLEAKITELSRKYFIAANSGNGYLAEQVLVVLDQYRTELTTRNLSQSTLPTKLGDTDIDDLIKIT
jgi:hypothetical protein